MSQFDEPKFSLSTYFSQFSKAIIRKRKIRT